MDLNDEKEGDVNPIMKIYSKSIQRSLHPDHPVNLQKSTLAGRIEPATLNVFDFEKQRKMYEKHGYAQNPKNPDELISGRQPSEKGTIKKKRIKFGEAADVEGYKGPWAGFEGEQKGEKVAVAPSEEEVSKFLNEKARLAPATLSGHITLGQEKSVFHGREERDYLDRSYMTPPVLEGISFNKEPGEFACFAPKKLLHTWTGHTKGVNSIQFIPKTGHLLLSAAQDQRIKLWDVYGSRECLRTFYGHNKPVREINFNHDGGRFISCAFDKAFKYWDTESGKCIFAKEHSSVPYCGRIHPDPDKSHIILVGTADRKVLEWDTRANEIIQEYAQHNGAVNSITFYHDNKYFVTSSDDRTLRVWEHGNGNSIKTISEPDMQSMPFAAHHPTEPFIGFQSLANQVMIYSFHDILTLRNRRFAGHSTSGYACQVGFSPDGKYLYSGDGRGQVVIWNWQNGQITRRLDAHPQVCMGVEWNPQHPSLMATCSWDGTIKLWE